MSDVEAYEPGDDGEDGARDVINKFGYVERESRDKVRGQEKAVTVVENSGARPGKGSSEAFIPTSCVPRRNSSLTFVLTHV